MKKIKDYEPFSCKLDKNISEKLQKFCNDTGLSKTKTVEKALEKYITDYRKTGKIK